jgi:integrase
MARRTLTDKGVEALKRRDKLYNFADPQLPGHYVRVWATGAKTFVVVARDPNGKQVWHTVGNAAHIGIDVAREKAREAVAAIKEGTARGGSDTFATVAENWLKRHVDAKGLRSAVETRRYLNRDILPAFGAREFTSIKRGDIAKLLDAVEDKAGPVAADNVLKRISAICTWFAARHGDYLSPIVKGMRRSATAARARDRILNDAELRAVWEAANGGTFGAMVKTLLLTGQRREKVAAMRWQDISVDGVWTIPAEDREKGNAQELKLPDVALDIIKTLPRFSANPYVFASRGCSHVSGYSKAKKALDAKTEVAPWRLHDLRRTARSLMARADIRPDIAERVLGHAIGGVEGVYNRHDHAEHKAHALRALAALVSNIVNPNSNVTSLQDRAGRTNRGR